MIYAINSDQWKAAIAASNVISAWNREIDAKIEQERAMAIPLGDSNYVYRGTAASGETIRVENCGWADREWVHRSDYEAVVAELVKVRKELELAGAVGRLSVLPHSADVVPAEGHYREVKEMRAEIERLEAERRKFELMWKSVAAISPVNGDMVSGERYERDVAALRHEIARLEGANRDLEERPQVWSDEAACLRLEEENAALRSQLAIAEERRRPARHRPGAVVNVGWDPEGE